MNWLIVGRPCAVDVLQFRVAVDIALNVTSCSASSVPMTTDPYGGSSLLSASSSVCSKTTKVSERLAKDVQIPPYLSLLIEHISNVCDTDKIVLYINYLTLLSYFTLNS